MAASTPAAFPRRSHARSNHARILVAAREELSRNPDASLDEIARAAGVVRRTLYGHFPNRQALLAALVEEAGQAVQEAFDAVRRPDDDPCSAAARIALAAWAVGDRYRMLIALGRRDLDEESINAALGPARAEGSSVIERGQRDGTFAGHLPPPVLALALEAVILTLLESRTPEITPEAGATAVLIAAGVPHAAASRCVHRVLVSPPPNPRGC
jgi:AcrR family transcriptional regulator